MRPEREERVLRYLERDQIGCGVEGEGLRGKGGGARMIPLTGEGWEAAGDGV